MIQVTYRSTLTSIMHGLGSMPWRYERRKMNHLSRLYQASILVTGVLLASASYADKSTEKKRVLSANKVSQENCTPFDLKSVDIRKVKRRWKLVDGKTAVPISCRCDHGSSLGDKCSAAISRTSILISVGN